MNETGMAVDRRLNRSLTDRSSLIFKTLFITLKNMTCFVWLGSLYKLCSFAEYQGRKQTVRFKGEKDPDIEKMRLVIDRYLESIQEAFLCIIIIIIF